MNISSVDLSGVPAVSSVAGIAPGNTVESPPSAQKTGGHADVGPAQVKQMVEDMQSHLDSMNVSLQYSLYGEHDNKIAVKVVNKGTGEVIREIPAKEVQSLQAKMSEMVGMIFNGNG